MFAFFLFTTLTLIPSTEILQVLVNKSSMSFAHLSTDSTLKISVSSLHTHLVRNIFRFCFSLYFNSLYFSESLHSLYDTDLERFL